MLGPNVQELLTFCDGSLSIKSIVCLTMQMIQRLQVLHDAGYLHRDLKPESILIGHAKKQNIVYLSDFSLVKRYVCPNSGYHYKHVPNKGVFGSKRYLSLNAHVGN